MITDNSMLLKNNNVEERDLKKHITIFVLITLVLSMIIPVFAADATVNNPIVTGTQSVRL